VLERVASKTSTKPGYEVIMLKIKFGILKIKIANVGLSLYYVK